MGPNPISQEAIEAYCRMKGVVRLDQLEEVQFVVARLEGVWAEKQRERQQQQGS